VKVPSLQQSDSTRRRFEMNKVKLKKMQRYMKLEAVMRRAEGALVARCWRVRPARGMEGQQQLDRQLP
jgi:hypothetical protein